ncbi:hypothetical protein KJ909_01625 [Patescibacteria group bacterium]|nr:hypothetical protein [Patescibacteria group bacterium]
MSRLLFNKILIIITVFLIVYFSRWTLFYKFDPVYWENFYYESQWNIPNSQRVIPDGGVYRFVGYKLANGENPFNIDYWVPPAGKYLYGLSAKYLNNPYFASITFYLALVLVDFFLSSLLFKDQFSTTISALLLATNPLITHQITLTMLDLPQALFITTHIFFLFKKNILLSGIFLGLALGTKIGYFIPAIALLDIFYLYKNKIKFKKLFYFSLSILSGYVLAYFCYFIKHPNPIPWLRLHQKILNFWHSTPLFPSPYNFFTYIFSNKIFQVLGNKRVWMNSSTWSVIFPISIFSLAINLIKKSKNKNFNYLVSFSITWIILLTLVDFWPRYLIPLIPILILILVNTLKTKKLFLFIITLLSLINLKSYIFPNPTDTFNQIKQYIDAGSFKEIEALYSKTIKQDKYPTNHYNIDINQQTKLDTVLVKINNQWKILSYSINKL